MKLVEWGVIGLEIIAFLIMISILILTLPMEGLLSDLAIIHLFIDLTSYLLLAFLIDEKIRRKR